MFGTRAKRLGQLLAEVVPAGARVLDIGCGDGRVAAALLRLRPDLTVTGVEVVRRRRCAIPMAVYDGDQLPMVDGAVDVALCVDVLHHAADAGRTLADAARVSRGLVVVKDFLPAGRLYRRIVTWVDTWGTRLMGGTGRSRFRSRAEWDALWRDLGFRVVEVRERLALFPFPVSLFFGPRFNFLAVLRKER